MRCAAIVCLLAVCLLGAAEAKSFPNFVAALGQPNFSRIKGVVNMLGLTGTFSNPALKLTVFTPTNNAFASAEAKTGISFNVLAQQKSLMQQVVYYHIAKEVVRAPLPKRAITTFVAGKTLTGDGMIVRGIGANSAKIIEPNVQCGAGLAHGIDGVLTFLNIGALGH